MPPENGKPHYGKDLKDEDGRELDLPADKSSTEFPGSSSGPRGLWKNGLGVEDLGHRTLNVKIVAKKLARGVAAANGANSSEQTKAANAITSARFALQMIEGTPLVRFSVRAQAS